MQNLDLAAFDRIIALDLAAHAALAERGLPDGCLRLLDVDDPMGQRVAVYYALAEELEARLPALLEEAGVL